MRVLQASLERIAPRVSGEMFCVRKIFHVRSESVLNTNVIEGEVLLKPCKRVN